MRRSRVGPAGHNNIERNPVFRGITAAKNGGSEPKETLC